MSAYKVHMAFGPQFHGDCYSDEEEAEVRGIETCRACLVARLHYPIGDKLSPARLTSYNCDFLGVFGSSYEPS
jgi:hypothetical protein